MEKETLTPGRLYAQLSQEFHKLRPDECHSCQMPMVRLAMPRSFHDPNWEVEPHRCCEKCGPLIEAIVQRMAERYDLNDPVSIWQGRAMPISYPPHASQ